MTKTGTGYTSIGYIPRRRCVGCNVLIEKDEPTFWSTVLGLGRHWKQGVGRVFHHECYIATLEDEVEQVKRITDFTPNVDDYE